MRSRNWESTVSAGWTYRDEDREDALVGSEVTSRAGAITALVRARLQLLKPRLCQ